MNSAPELDLPPPRFNLEEMQALLIAAQAPLLASKAWELAGQVYEDPRAITLALALMGSLDASLRMVERWFPESEYELHRLRRRALGFTFVLHVGCSTFAGGASVDSLAVLHCLFMAQKAKEAYKP